MLWDTVLGWFQSGGGSAGGANAELGTCRREKGIDPVSQDGKLSIIMPTLNEEKGIEKAITSVKNNRCTNCKVEIVVVDGGSSDNTVRRAKALGAKVIRSERGRGIQQDEGSKAASGDYFLFLHADTELPKCYDTLLYASLSKASAGREAKHIWGAFEGLDIKVSE